MAVGYVNIFPLDQSEKYTCSIDYYRISHKELRIAVSREGTSPFYLLFVDVRYFSGPTSWQGANFHLIKKPDEHLKILESLRCFKKWPQEFLLERTQVYQVDAPDDVEIKIVAAEVERIENL
jgi:hypothetical protein